MPVSISSESESPIPVTISSVTDSAQTVSSERTPEVALVSEVIAVNDDEDGEDDQRSDTVQHLDSESDDLEILEAEVATARAKREEQEALEKLARARRARGSNASSRSVRSSISSARFERADPSRSMQPVQPAVPVQPVPSVPADPNPAPALQSLEHQPELPTVRSGWMDWFAAHAPRRQGPLSAEDAQRISELAGNADPNPAFVGPYLAARNRVSELERATAQSATGSDRGKGVSRYLDEKDWELQSVRARVRELEDMIQMRESRASFESAASRELQEERPPGSLPARQAPVGSDRNSGPVASVA